MAPLIGLYSPAPGSGKSTLAAAMAGFGWQSLKFAGPLKAMLVALLREAGEDDAVIARALEGDLKAQELDALGGRTPRFAMQTLGTEWGRETIAQDIWVRTLIARANRLRASGVAVVVDDMRFVNEASAIQAAGGKLVRVTRGAMQRPSGHASEGGLDDWSFDMDVANAQSSGLAFGLQWAGPVSAFGWR